MIITQDSINTMSPKTQVNSFLQMLTICLLCIRLLFRSLRHELAILILLKHIPNVTYVVVKIRAMRGLIDITLPDNKVTEVLPFIPFPGVLLDHWLHNL